MSRRTYDHTHQYVRISANIYRCIFPGKHCPHTIQRLLLIGRAAHCPLCHRDFTITLDHLRRKVLHCLECKKNPDLRVTENMQIEIPGEENGIFEELLKETYGKATDDFPEDDGSNGRMLRPEV